MKPKSSRRSAAFCPGADVQVTVLDVPDGRAPAHWERIKNHLSDFRKSCIHRWCSVRSAATPIKIIGCSPKLLPTEFRDHLVLGYEILKWEADTPRPTIFHPLETDVAEEKARLLLKHYPSQAGHDWFDEEAFLGLSRLRGVQCRNQHAEAFIVEKATVTFGRRSGRETSVKEQGCEYSSRDTRAISAR